MVDVATATEVGGQMLSPEAVKYISAGLVMAISAIAAAWSQSSIGAALMGAAAERPELESKAIIYIALPEVIALLGFVVALLMVVT